MNPPRFRIRAVVPADAAALERIEQATQAMPWSRRAFSEEASVRPRRCFVLESLAPGKKVIGYGACRTVADEAYLMNLAVHPRFQRRGGGRTILGFLCRRARERGAARMHLDVRAGNASAVQFYRAMGFREAGRRPGGYPDGSDGLTMTMKFSDEDQA